MNVVRLACPWYTCKPESSIKIHILRSMQRFWTIVFKSGKYSKGSKIIWDNTFWEYVNSHESGHSCFKMD